MKLIFALIFLYSSSIFAAEMKAGILTEPYAGYFKGETEGDDIGDADITSYTYGARLGYQTESGWNYGIDYAQGRGKREATGEEKFDYNTKDGGFFIGYKFPAYVQVWASYIIKHEATIKEYNAGADVETEGKGYNIGVGVRGIPFVTVNISYQERDIDTVGDADGLSGNKVKLTMLSLSLPYNFPWKP